ncbi:MAG: ATPase, T2SS/T4P/T4SS family, partial [Gammaproteobacteria bacterium]|nr:ATPase, T2SS/T4P/T4SS family [Gammaproteobacteria bacterium]
MAIPDLLASAIERGASDVHLSAGLPPLIRVDGDIEPLVAEPVLARELRAWIEDMATDRDRQDFAERHEADFSLAVPAVGRFRVNVFESRRGPGAVFRTVPEAVPTLQDLGLGPTFQQIAQAPRGLVLVTGPTGSGKSTTLAAMIDHVNRTRRGHILTIEDPIEFVHEPRRSLVNQREVGRDTSTLSGALR